MAYGLKQHPQEHCRAVLSNALLLIGAAWIAAGALACKRAGIDSNIPQDRAPRLRCNGRSDQREVRMTPLRTALLAAIGLLASPAHAQMGGGMSPQSTPQREDPTVPYQAGVAALNAGDHAEAIRQLRTARRALPSDGNINYALGLAYNASGDKEEARTAFERAARARNAPISARLQLGLVALALGDLEAATQQQAALERMVASCDSQCGDAQRGQMQSALQQLTQALTAQGPAAP